MAAGRHIPTLVSEVSGGPPAEDAWPTDLDVAAVELVSALRWQLGRIRSTALDPEGLQARQRVWAGRDRVFTLISGIPDADPVVIERALLLALGAVSDTAAPSDASNGSGQDPSGGPATTQANVDKQLSAAIAAWRALDLPSFWKTVAAYVTATKANLAEQIMLLTYFESLLPVDPAADPTADLTVPPGQPAPAAIPDVTDLVAGVSLVSVSSDPLDVYATCGQLTVRGAEASTSFTTQVALLALAALAPDLSGGPDAD